jgi:hypothetical protein
MGRGATDTPPLELPEWVTIAEAEFVTRLDRAEIERAVDAGTVASKRLVAGSDAVVVRSADLRALGVAGPPDAGVAWHGPEPRRRRTVVALIGTALGATALLVVALSLRAPAPRDRPATDRAATSVGPSTGTTAATASASAATSPGETPSEPAAASPARLAVASVRFVQQGTWASAVAVLANPSAAEWLPRDSVRFEAVDPSGATVATYTTTVSLAPGQRRIVAAPAMLLAGGTNVAAVRVVPFPPVWQAAETFAAQPSVSGVDVSAGRVTGTVSTGGVAGTATVQVSCALTLRGSLVGVAVTSLPELASGASAPFVATPPFVRSAPDAASCVADRTT